jgi:amino acid adenylation domain-containing protein
VSVIGLLKQLNEKNVTLSIKGDELAVQGKRQALTPEFLTLLRENKGALVELIKSGKYVGPRRAVIDVPPNLIPTVCDAITPEMLPLVELNAAEIEQITSKVPGGSANIQDIYPLAPLQEGILFHHLLATEGDVYLTPTLLSFDTRARLDKFLHALQAVIDRHDILRTAVLWEGLREAAQVVWRQAPLVVKEISFEATAGNVGEELRTRFDPRHYRLDVRQAPLMRVCIAYDAREDRWMMLHLYHHLSVDHITYEIVLEEVQAHLLGRAERLPAPLPFRNLVAQARQGVTLEEHEAFFREMLGDVDEPTAPFGLINVQGDGSGIREARREVDARLAIRLRQAARAFGVSSACLYHEAWALVLARLAASVSGRNDVVFGTVLLGRMQGGEGSDRALGLFMNTLPIRIRVGARGVDESIGETHRLLTELLRHEHAPLALAQRCSGVAAPTPLFSVFLNYRHDSAPAAAEESFSAWEGIELLASRQLTNYPFLLDVSDLGENFRMMVQVESPGEPDRICAYMHTALERLVEALEKAPTTPLRNLNVLPASESHQLLVEWNETGRPYPNDRCIHHLFEEQVEKNPEAVAVVFGQQGLTYGELNTRADLLAGALVERGVGPEVLVGLCLERSIEMIVALLGTLKAGGAYLPLDPEYPTERLIWMLENAEVKVLLTEKRTKEKTAAVSSWAAGPVLCLDSEWEAIGRECEKPADAGVVGENLAYVLYTSGSTGRPKGAQIGHRALVNFTLAMKERLGLREGDRILQFASLSFDVSAEEIYPTLCCGATVVLARGEEIDEPVALQQLLEKREVSGLELPTAYWHEWVNELGRNGGALPSSLRFAIVGGEPPLREKVAKWLEYGAGLFNAYGLTETAITNIVRSIEGEIEKDELWRELPIGRPIANNQVYILNSEHMPAPMGVVGEIYIGGEGLARAYQRRPDLTAERFAPHPFSSEPGALLYRTGDLASYRAGGDIEFLGRRDQQVKVRGFRIELGEIEEVLRKHESVEQALVHLREQNGENKQLVAYIVPKTRSNGAMPDKRTNRLSNAALELFPSHGEYFIYDEIPYLQMTKDELRNRLYRRAIRSRVKGKTVVDIGTGGDIVLTKMCVEAGAVKIYAIEHSEEGYQAAKSKIRQLGLEQKVALIKGDARQVDLPEKVDVSVSELIGTVGSAEGVIPILNNARRFLKEGGEIIPFRCVTRIAGVSFGNELEVKNGLSEVSTYHLEKIYESLGRKFDVRMCVKNVNRRHIITEEADFEDLELTKEMEEEAEREINLKVLRRGKIDGFILWIRLETEEGMALDALEDDCNWLPVYYPVFYPGIEVNEADEIEMRGRRVTSDNGLNPDYIIKGKIKRIYGEDLQYKYESRRHPATYKEGGFYLELNEAVESGGVITSKTITQYLRERLPSYMIPSAYVLLDQMPLTPNGKVDRRSLPAPESNRGWVEYEESRTPVEEMLCNIWSEVLLAERVGVRDNFFELGGHSLLATQVIARVRTTFQVEFPMTVLFENPTISELAESVEQALKSGRALQAPPLAPVSREGRSGMRLPLSFAQQRLWFLDQLAPNDLLYNISDAVKLEGRLDLEALERVINEIVRRHEVLRTRIETEDGDPAQVIDEWEERRLDVEDLSGLPVEEREEAARKITREEAMRGFDLSKGPLLRVKILKLEEERHVLLFTAHHIVSDDWSMGVLVREVGALYQAYSAGEDSPLEELPIQYADFAVWQREWLKGEALEGQMNYWRKQLEYAPELKLPTRNSPQRYDAPFGASYLQIFPADVARAVKSYSEEKKVTLFMLLLAAFAIALHRLTGQRDLVIGADIANRNRVETEPLIGFFVNELLLRIKIEDEPTFDELVEQARETALNAYLYQDVPFDKLVEMLNPARRNNGDPLIRAKLVVQNAPRSQLTLPALTIGGPGYVSDMNLKKGVKCDFLLTFFENEEELVAHVTYNETIMQKSTTVALLRSLEELLTIAIEDPTLKLSALMSKLADVQRQRQKQRIASSFKMIESAR